MSSVKKARKIMREAFDADPDFKMGYIANIAMLLYDRLEKDGITLPNEILDYDKRNAAAEDILELIFYS